MTSLMSMPLPTHRRILLLGPALLSTMVLLTACQATRTGTITSECQDEVQVFERYRVTGGVDVMSDDPFTVKPGTVDYANGVDVEYSALVDESGAVIAEATMPADQLDDQGENPFPAMVIPAEACDRLTPVEGSG